MPFLKVGQPSAMLASVFEGWIDGSLPEFDESSSFDWTINLADIPQTEVDHVLVLVLPQPTYETSTRQRLPQSKGRKAIFGETKVK